MARTPNYNLELIDFNKIPWHTREHDNWRSIDAIFANFITVNQMQGVWQNATAVTVGQRFVDAEAGTILTVLIAHTTASTGLFSADRTANPTYWELFSDVALAESWASSLAGLVNSVDYSSKAYAIGTVTQLPDGSAKRWAVEVENTEVISGSYSALHHATKAAASAVSTAADLVATNQDSIDTAADLVETAADVVLTNADVVLTHADEVLTRADTVLTAADAVSTAADKASASASAATASAAAAGIYWKAPVKVGSVAGLTLIGTQTIDGIAVGVGDRVLVKNQTAAEDNGVYTVASGAWSRTVPLNEWDEFVGAVVLINQGTVNENTAYQCTVIPGGTLDSDDITWAAFGAVAVNFIVNNFAAGGGFTAGSTTALTLTVAPGSEQNITVTFDGVTQHHNTYSIGGGAGTTLTFSSAIPTGTANIEVKVGSSLGIGTPSDGTVTAAKMSSNSVDSDSYVDGSIDPEHLAANAVIIAKLEQRAQTAVRMSLYRLLT
jgi:hypothetical protein